ncbi:polysaccharide deacetylase family protein [Curtobacterium sp. VKM Ac-2922]|uniref:polysaccharide deacetylase family protein n=1 Tax=Curtobacterium sp. VKM Ac-2922 TaxID=2929475 RepID=UPI001FB2EE12|nr:polysaccharide deacetylase family protein [Curtobacterium sp. VKM Ac-2922]MCJ1715917.1 polysaccharide deacetylase family protein [Curtobacterium sp. VKM Ac-2922]
MTHRPARTPSRRALLSGIGGTVLAGTLAACSGTPSPRASTTATARNATPSTSPTRTPTPTPTPTPTRPALQRQPLPHGTVTGLPEGTPGIAWTVDDGASSEVVEAYARFAAETGTRLTFFVNGVRPSWTDHADLLRPLVASGQVQLGNHTWDHPALTKLSDQGIIDQLTRNDDFIQDTFGVSAKPYFRPPFGYHDARVDAAAARAGYTTPLLWYGSLADSGDITSDQIVGFAQQWFLPAHIVIGHANFPGTIGALPRLHELLQERQLATYTLDDVFSR